MNRGRRYVFLVCGYAALGFGMEAAIAPVLPLLVIDRGGDAAIVGLLVLCYGVPSIVLRPLLGRWFDTPVRVRVVRAGVALVAMAPLGYVIPALAPMIPSRIAQGVGWAVYGTSGHTLLAEVTPPDRRGEANGYFNAMPAVAVLLGPVIGLWLYANADPVAPFLFASMLGLTGLALTFRLPLRLIRDPEHRVDRRGLIGGVLDSAAIVPMVLTAAFMSVQSLFIIFAPLYARAYEIPIEQLAIYYPVYGTVVLFAMILLGRASDRFGRWPTIVIGCTIGIGGLLSIPLIGGLAGLLVGAALYGVATALTTSSIGAVAMEWAQPNRTGSAMATYSLGYQLGASVGGLLWGATISIAGYPWPFVVAAAMIALTLLIAALTVPRRLAARRISAVEAGPTRGGPGPGVP